MNIETTIAKNIRTANDKARYDAACKRLLAEKIILARIMKACVPEYSNCDVQEIAEKYIEERPQIGEIPVMPDTPPIISGTGTEDVSMTEGTITYDIRFSAAVPDSKAHIRLIINVEAQNDFYPGYPLIKRGIYYGSRMISSQYGTEFTQPHYGNIRKVYSIWICMNPPKNRENSITRYSIAEENLIGNVKEERANYDLMTIIMIGIGNPRQGDKDSILRLLNILFSTEKNPKEKCRILEEDFKMKMTQTLESEVSLMCNLSKGVEEQGIQKGLQKGREEGIRGMASAMRELEIPEQIIAQKLREKFGLSVEEAKRYVREG